MKPAGENLLTIKLADLSNDADCSHIVALVNEYRCDPMGGFLGEIAKDSEQELLHGLRDHPSSMIYFVCYNNTIAGMAVCFIGFSTFKAKRLLNIHDLILFKEYRNKGIGTWFLQKIADNVSKIGYCKLTLEVRIDNESAKKVYRKAGFTPCADPMEFWIKEL